MSQFLAVKDNPFDRKLVNIYRNGKYWKAGQVMGSGYVHFPTGERTSAVAPDVASVNRMLNRRYLGVA